MFSEVWEWLYEFFSHRFRVLIFLSQIELMLFMADLGCWITVWAFPFTWLSSCWWLILRSDVVHMKRLGNELFQARLQTHSLLDVFASHWWTYATYIIYTNSSGNSSAGGAGSLVAVVAVYVSVSRNTWKISSLIMKSVGLDGSVCSWLLTARLQNSIISVMWLYLI